MNPAPSSSLTALLVLLMVLSSARSSARGVGASWMRERTENFKSSIRKILSGFLFRISDWGGKINKEVKNHAGED
nr:MAG TPA: hypothetical protein [Caudoviricetes sp.]